MDSIKRMQQLAGLLTESLDPVGKEDADIDNDGKKNTPSDEYILNRRKTISKNIKKEGMDHEVSMAQNSLEAIAKAAIELSQKIGSIERNIPGWIQDHITNAENYIEQAAQGFHELNEGPRIGELPVRTYKLVQGKEAELAKIKNPKVIDYIKKNPENINIKDLAKLLSVREQAALQYINTLKTLGALVSKNPTTSKSMSSDDVEDLFK